MTSVVSIWNQALNLAGARSTIASVTENSAAAQACAMYYDSVRTGAMRAAYWNCLKKTITATLLKAAPGTEENPVAAPTVWSNTYPPPGWLYSYAYPADAIAIRCIIPQVMMGYGGVPISTAPSWMLPALNIQKLAVPFAVESDVDAMDNYIKVVVTNQTRAIMVYTVDAQNPDSWDTALQQVVINALAASVVPKLSGNMKLMNQLYSIANDVIVQARQQDANEGLVVNDVLPDWIQARNGLPGLGSTVQVGYFGPLGPLFGGA